VPPDNPIGIETPRPFFIGRESRFLLCPPSDREPDPKFFLQFFLQIACPQPGKDSGDNFGTRFPRLSKSV
jgi:hypothetical protein